MLWKHGSFNHINVTFDMMHPKSTLGWLVTITMFITAIDFLYYHLINPKKVASLGDYFFGVKHHSLRKKLLIANVTVILITFGNKRCKSS